MTDQPVPTQSKLVIPTGITAGMGFEKGDSRDRSLGRIIILQPQSPLVAKKQAEAGDFFNTMTNKNYGQVIRGVAIMKQPQRLRRILLDGQTKRIPVCRSADSVRGEGDPGGECRKCPHAKWAGGVKPSCDLIATYPFLVKGETSLFAFGFSGSMHDAGREIYQQSRFVVPVRPMFASEFELTTELVTKDSFNWYVPKPVRVGEPTQEEFNLAYKYFQALEVSTITVENPQAEEMAGGTGAAPEMPAGAAAVPEDDIPF